MQLLHYETHDPPPNRPSLRRLSYRIDTWISHRRSQVMMLLILGGVMILVFGGLWLSVDQEAIEMGYHEGKITSY